MLDASHDDALGYVWIIFSTGHCGFVPCKVHVLGGLKILVEQPSMSVCFDLMLPPGQISIPSISMYVLVVVQFVFELGNFSGVGFFSSVDILGLAGLTVVLGCKQESGNLTVYSA